ncbi:UNVERIFIED_CONTAM: hypothetical protein FKN15_055537 [Acipenser sinensis]
MPENTQAFELGQVSLKKTVLQQCTFELASLDEGKIPLQERIDPEGKRRGSRRLERRLHSFTKGSWRGRQPIDIRLSVMAVTRRGLPIENITGAEALVESCGDGEPQKKKRETEQSISSSRGETLGSPVYER